MARNVRALSNRRIGPRRACVLLVALFSVASLASCGGTTRADMPPGWSDDVSAAERARLRVVVFADDVGAGETVLALLRQAGYTNPASYVHGSPTATFDVKWGPGGASDGAVEEIAAIVGARVGQPFDRRPELEEGEADVFVNLPLVERGVELPPVSPGGGATDGSASGGSARGAAR